MDQQPALDDALASDDSQVIFVTETGADALECPPGFDVDRAEVIVPMSPLDPFDPDSLGNAVATFLAARTDGYGSTHVNMSDGSGSMLMQAFDMRAELDCIMCVLTPSDAKAPLLTPPDVDLPVRMVSSKLDATGRTLEINDNLTKLLGWTIDEFLGQSSIERVHPDDHDRAIHSFGELLGRPGGQTRIRQRLRHRDGSWRWFEVTHTNLLHTDAPHVLSESLDVSAEMAVSLALQEREALLTSLTESLPIGIVHLKNNGDIEMVNAAWRRMTGAETGDSVETLISAFDEFESVRALIDLAKVDASDVDMSASITNRRGDDRSFDLSIRALDGPESSHSLVITLTDVTAEVALQQLATRC